MASSFLHEAICCCRSTIRVSNSSKLVWALKAKQPNRRANVRQIRTMVRICLTFALLFGCFAFNAQTNLELLETRIVDLQQQMASCRNDEAMSAYDDSLRTTIIDVMNSDGAFDYPFSKVKSMSILKPNDESFRLFNWNIPKMDQTHGYHCFMLQVTDAKNGIYNWVDKRFFAEILSKRDFDVAFIHPFSFLHHKGVKT